MVEKILLDAKDVSERLGVSVKSARRIMVHEMRSVSVSSSKSNPRYRITEDELFRWIDRSARIQARPESRSNVHFERR